MTDQKYVYSNIVVSDPEAERLNGFFVVRLWHERLNKPDIICQTRSRVDTELVSEALNQTLGLTPDEVDALIKSWLSEDPDAGWEPAEKSSFDI